ncbi:putative membrane protein [Natronospira proteinivora]|uniref:Membrane protein n=1 Tax=Natronospira proteinivora TaxID=1807133 RepID=A0ABT1G8M1_9GAMM|nr:hypothetical protein [Natronospira proteinivora]MCP1727669.1 putative membrane protein [Natronospira proteinivora]
MSREFKKPGAWKTGTFWKEYALLYIVFYIPVMAAILLSGFLFFPEPYAIDSADALQSAVALGIIVAAIACFFSVREGYRVTLFRHSEKTP